MYFLSKLDAEVLLPTQSPFSWRVFDFVHQTRGNTRKRSKIRLELHQRGSGNPIEGQKSAKVWWCREILLGRSGLVVMILRTRNHTWTQSYHLMKALLETMLWYTNQLLYDTYLHTHTRTHIYIYIYISSCRAVSMDLTDPLSPPLFIVHCFWQVFLATSSINTELLYVGSSWTSILFSSRQRGSQEYITYELVPTSPAVTHLSCSCNFDSFRDGW